MIQTAGDLIQFVLRASGINGVGQTPSAEDSNTGLQFLHDIVAGWQKKRWMVPNLIDMPIVSTGAQSYSIGPSRPAILHSAYARILPAGANPVDLPLSIIASREDYSNIGLKSLGTFPAVCFYDTAWPTGQVYVWPIPPAGQFELHFIFPGALPTYTALTDPIDLPPEYMEALIWSLAVRMEMAYGMDVNPNHGAAMHQAMNVVTIANTQISELLMPAGIAGRRGSSMAAGSSPWFMSGGMS